MKPLPLLIILLLLTHIATNGCRVALTLFAIKLEASAFAVGALIALYSFLPALFSVTSGRWIDRVGLARPVLIGAIGLGIGVVLPFLMPVLPILYLASAVVGVSFMLCNIAAYHAVGEMSIAEERPTNFSYLALGFSVSSFIAPIFAGVAIDSLGYRATFLLLALFTVLPIIAVALGTLDVPHTRKPHQDAETKAAGSSVWDLLKQPALRHLFVIMAILTLAWDVYGFAIPVHGTAMGLSASQIGIVMGAFAAGNFTVRLALPFLVQRIKPWTMLTIALAVSGLSYIAVPFSGSVALLMALMFCLGLGLGAPQPMVLTLLHESAPPGRAGEALGLRTTLINTSQTVMPLIFGALGTALGMAPLFWGIAAILLVGSVSSRWKQQT